jgi:hypothetical protein
MTISTSYDTVWILPVRASAFSLRTKSAKHDRTIATLRQHNCDSTTVRWWQYDGTMVTVRQCNGLSLSCCRASASYCHIVTIVLSHWSLSYCPVRVFTIVPPRHRDFTIVPSCFHHRSFMFSSSCHRTIAFLPSCIAGRDEIKITIVQTEHRNLWIRDQIPNYIVTLDLPIHGKSPFLSVVRNNFTFIFKIKLFIIAISHLLKAGVHNVSKVLIVAFLIYL